MSLVKSQARNRLDLPHADFDVDTVDTAGRTALMMAAKNGNGDMVRVLLDLGADPHLRNHQRQQAVNIAEAAGNQTVIQIIETHPARKKGLLGLFK